MTQEQPSKYICIGCITGAQGLKGCVRVRAFTQDPLDITSYGPLLDEEGHPLFDLHLMHKAKDTVVVARIEGVNTREEAESHRGTNLYVPRENLPDVEEDETYYHSDLKGLQVLDPSSTLLGIIQEVHDFGAGVVLEVLQDETKKSFMLPFRSEMVPVVNVKEGHIQVNPDACEIFFS